MLTLHGSGSNASVQLQWGQWVECAEREGFIVVAPESVAIHADGILSSEGKSVLETKQTDFNYIRWNAASTRSLRSVPGGRCAVPVRPGGSVCGQRVHGSGQGIQLRIFPRRVYVHAPGLGGTREICRCGRGLQPAVHRVYHGGPHGAGEDRLLQGTRGPSCR